MRTFLSEAETLLEIRKCCQRATRIRAALALITCSGLRLIEDDLEGLLTRGGGVQVLLGTDMATEPEAIEALLNLQEQYSGRLTVRRYASNTSQTFHPKAWLFSFRSGPGSAVVGSSNLTQGGLDRNLEANVFLNGGGAVGELETFFDELFEGGRARYIDTSWLDAYRDIWQQQRATQLKLDRIQKKTKAIRTRRTVSTTVPTRIRDHAYAFTGGIAGWPRDLRLYPTIKRYGGTVVEIEGLHKAECLVHGDRRGGRKTTRKLRAARHAGIDIINESDFFRILANEIRLRNRNRTSSVPKEDWSPKPRTTAGPRGPALCFAHITSPGRDILDALTPSAPVSAAGWRCGVIS